MMRIGRNHINIAFALISITACVACSVYQEDLAQIRAGNTNANGATDSRDAAFSTVVVAGDGGVGRGDTSIAIGGKGGNQTGTAGQPATSILSEGCGDGRVTGTEKCDIAIENGATGACPNQCPTDQPCTIWELKGTGCSAECVASSPECKSGDGCCPPNCNSKTDADCSSTCGDGFIQAESGETCEPAQLTDGGALPDANLVCPTTCPDDGKSCTEEQLSGNAANCNAVCEHVTITSIVNGDGCCPDGANANTDSDCKPICGNDIREANEQCDGTTGCSDTCQSTLTEEQQKCVDSYHYANGGAACDQCMCANCPNTFALCYGSGDKALDAACAKIIACGYEHNCVGSICYCGDTALDSYGLCLGTPNGPCKQVIEEAAGTTDITTIFYMQMDLGNALGRSRALGDCYDIQCADVCRASTSSSNTSK
jgi:hypothetical protein